MKDLFKLLIGTMPAALQPPRFEPGARGFGAINELFPWLVEPGLDTELLIENPYSELAGGLDATTAVTLSARGTDGMPLAERRETLRPYQTLRISMRDWLNKEGRGTISWHAAFPKALADAGSLSDARAFVLERGSVALRAGGQLACLSPAGLYSVFQGLNAESSGTWDVGRATTELGATLPLGPGLGCEALELLVPHRGCEPALLKTELLDRGGAAVERRQANLYPNGLLCERFEASSFAQLSDAGSLRLSGLPRAALSPVLLTRYPGGLLSLARLS